MNSTLGFPPAPAARRATRSRRRSATASQAADGLRGPVAFPEKGPWAGFPCAPGAPSGAPVRPGRRSPLTSIARLVWGTPN